jgi:hypothetical protein
MHQSAPEIQKCNNLMKREVNTAKPHTRAARSEGVNFGKRGIAFSEAFLLANNSWNPIRATHVYGWTVSLIPCEGKITGYMK